MFTARKPGGPSPLTGAPARRRSARIKTGNFYDGSEGEKVAGESCTLTAADGPFYCRATPRRCAAAAEKYAPAEPPLPRLQSQSLRVVSSFARRSPASVCFVCLFVCLFVFFPPCRCRSPTESAARVPDPPARENYGREADGGARHRSTAGDGQRWIPVRGCECVH